MTSVRAHPRAHPRHPRDDAPDTSAEFQELRSQVREAVQEPARAPDAPTPDVAGVAAHTGLSEADVRTGMETLGGFATLSLDAEPRGADDGFRLGISQMQVSRPLSATCARLGRQAGSGAA
ncbi:hypothetical protein [Streptomyces asiaticus]